MPYSKAKAKSYGTGPRAVIWPPVHSYAPDAQASQPSGKGQGTTMYLESRVNLMIAHWEAFANRRLRKLARIVCPAVRVKRKPASSCSGDVARKALRGVVLKASSSFLRIRCLVGRIKARPGPGLRTRFVLLHAGRSWWGTCSATNVNLQRRSRIFYTAFAL